MNTHARNIFAKVGVHSQQELLTLARTAVPSEATVPAGPAKSADARSSELSAEADAARA